MFPSDRDPRELSGAELDQMIMGAFQNMLEATSSASLTQYFQCVVSEMYIRSEDDVDWVETWNVADERVRSMFNPETTYQPEVLKEFQEERAKLNEMRNRRLDNAFSEEAMAEIEQLLDTHGVTEEPDDQAPGQYL